MKRRLGFIGLLLVAVGLVFIGQGLGLIRGRSLMVDDIRWAWAGGVTVLAGIGFIVVGRRQRAR